MSVEKTQKVVKVGKVISSQKMLKTLVVEVMRSEAHPKYSKLIKRRTKFYVHDEASRAKEGDSVRIQECRPISKTKTWTLLEVLDSGR